MRKTGYVLTWIEYLSARIPADIRKEGREQQLERELVFLHGLLPPDVDKHSPTLMDLNKLEGGVAPRTTADRLNALIFDTWNTK